MTNLKDVIIRNLQEENAKSRSSGEVPENKFNHLEQYAKRINIDVSGIPNSIGNNELKCSVIKIMKASDNEVDDRDIEACQKTGKSKESSKKTFVHLFNRNLSKRACFCNHISNWFGK